jgi:hypothetical protein
MKDGLVMEYRISDLARYMLNPTPVEIEKRLVGCEVLRNRPLSRGKAGKIGRLINRVLKTGDDHTETLTADSENRAPSLKDPGLESHLNKIYEGLMPYDQTLRRLTTLDMSKVSDILGVCEDDDGSRSWLNIQGGIDEKIHYICKHLQKEISVRLEKSYVADGLFEMRGYDFTTYDGKSTHRLIKFIEDGRTRCCVLDHDDNVMFWIEDISLVYYLHLLQQSIRTNPKLGESFKLCKEGNGKPLKLFFNRQIEVAYSKMHLPKTYREVFKLCNTGMDERDVVLDSLNHLQLGILFNYVHYSHSGEDRLFTSLSVMHDFRALDPLKDHLPRLYSEINKRVLVSEAGSFYLLDSLGGYKDELRL